MTWKRIEPTQIINGTYKHIVAKTFIRPGGQQAVFDTFGPEGARYAGIVALTSDKRVVVSRQYRVGPEKEMLEIPGGGVDAGEEPLAGAKRELFEETGYEVGEIEYLGEAFKDAYMNGTWHFFFATDCKRVSDQQLDENEHIDVELITIDELIANAKNGRMTDAIAVFMAKEKLQNLG
jgi:ADP-ribose pyrophosphatase